MVIFKTFVVDVGIMISLCQLYGKYVVGVAITISSAKFDAKVVELSINRQFTLSHKFWL